MHISFLKKIVKYGKHLIIGRDGRGSAFLKYLDYWVGIPILYTISLIRFKKDMPTQIKKIAILKSTAIGDTVILSGIIQSIKKSNPTIEIHLFVGQSNFVIAELLDDIKNVHLINVKNPLKAISSIRSQSFDIWINLGSWSRIEALYSCLSKSNFVVGFKTQKQYVHFAFDQYADHSSILHENNNYHKLINLIGFTEFHNPKISREKFLIPLVKDEKNFINHQSDKFYSQSVVFHMWSGGSQAEKKHWPTENWNQLAFHLLSNNFNIILTGSKSDFDKNSVWIKNIYSQLESNSTIEIKNQILNFAGISLKETIQVLIYSKLVVSVDTGIMHLAAALGAKVIGLHGPTHSKRWGGLGPNSIAIDALELEQAPINLGIENPTQHRDAMKKITVNEVLSWALSLLLR